MLGDKALLSTTLAATFLAGSVSGFAVRDARPDAPYLPSRADSVFKPQLEALRAKGYDDAEMKAALQVHQTYLNGYRHWWGIFQDQYVDNLNVVDDTFQRELAALEQAHQARTR